MDAKSAPAGEHVGPFQMVILVLSIVVLGALVADTVWTPPAEVSRVLQFVDFGVCIVFLVDFVVRFRAAKSKLAFMKWGWIDLLASIPAVHLLRWGRLLRLVRVLRILRGLRSLRLFSRLIFAHRTRGGVASVALIAFLVITFSSIGILICEEHAPNANIHNAEDAVWWSVTTVTTVGYGDKYPVTQTGRVIAMILMVSGVGLFGTLSGIVATFFLGESDEKKSDPVTELATEVRALREEVARLRERLPATPGSNGHAIPLDGPVGSDSASASVSSIRS